MGIFGHAFVERLPYRLFMTGEGIFGITLSTASTAIVVFILFGAFQRQRANRAVQRSGAGRRRTPPRRPGPVAVIRRHGPAH